MSSRPAADAADQYRNTGVPYYTVPWHPAYLCAFCDGDLPDGVQVAAVEDAGGHLAGVVTSADPSPYTPAHFSHRCGAGKRTVPDAIAHHDSTSKAARAARAVDGSGE